MNGQKHDLIIMIVTFCIASLSGGYGTAMANGECGPLANHYGPFDYTNSTHRGEKLPIVERNHFTSKVYRLETGITAEDPVLDIEYTLLTFPNHHLALEAMARLHRQRDAAKLPQATYSLACYFERARRFAPTDGMVSMIQGLHEFALGRLLEAEKLLLQAEQLSPQSAEVAYNLGLLYLRKKDYELANQYARNAYDLGYPLPGLKNKLVEQGAWQEP